MTRRRLIFLVFTAASCVTGAAEAQAAAQSQKLDRATLQSLLPTTELGSDAELAHDYINQRITPFGDPKLYFEIPVPKDWDSRPVEVPNAMRAHDDKSLVPLALITPNNEEAGVALEVQYLRVPKRATLERFLEAYPAQAGFTLLGRQDGEFNGRVVKEELLRMDTKDFGPVVTRLAVTRKDGRFLIVAGSAPEKEYEKVKKRFAVAIIGFNPDASPPPKH